MMKPIIRPYQKVETSNSKLEINSAIRDPNLHDLDQVFAIPKPCRERMKREYMRTNSITLFEYQDSQTGRRIYMTHQGALVGPNFQRV